MKKYELKLAAALLDLARGTFSNHGCNDFDLRGLVTEEEEAEMAREYAEWNGDDEPDASMSFDFVLMGWLAHRLEEEAAK